jgi:DNA-binding CsgD family transcriptional regulator
MAKRRNFIAKAAGNKSTVRDEKRRDASRRRGGDESTHKRAASLSPQAEKERLTMYSALTGEAFVDAALRFLLAVVPAFCSSISLRGAHHRSALWRSSRGDRADLETLDLVFENHPGYAVLVDNPGIKIIPTRGVLPPEPMLFETDCYRLTMKPFGWRHAVGLLFYERPTVEGLIGVLSVHRTAKQGDFTDAEISRLSVVHPIINRALRRVRKLEAEHRTLGTLKKLMRRLPLPAMLLGWDSQLWFQNDAAREACLTWRHGRTAARLLKPDVHCQVPEEIVEKCSDLRGEWESELQHPEAIRRRREAVVLHPRHREMRAAISMEDGDPAGIRRPSFLVQFQLPHQQPARGGAAAQRSASLAHLSRLTPREREVARLASDGLSNKEIAAKLGRGLSTIKKQLNSTFEKLGVKTRGKLHARLR